GQAWAQFQEGGTYNEYRLQTLKFQTSAERLMNLTRYEQPHPGQLARPYADLKARAEGFFSREHERVSARLASASSKPAVDVQVQGHVAAMRDTGVRLETPYVDYRTTPTATAKRKTIFDAAVGAWDAAQNAYLEFPHEEDAMVAGEGARDAY